MELKNTISINGQEYAFSPGETILQVAQKNGIFIPTLCYLKGTSPTGACRVCLVEVAGARSLVASCAMPAAPNMVVKTDTEKVHKARRLNIELLLASGHHYCVTCEADGDCRLQDLAYRYQIESVRYPETPPRYDMEVDPLIIRDFSRCIMCGRCVQACNEVQVNRAISYGYRGILSKIVTKADQPYANSDCVFCGECVQVCPVGALIPRPSRFKGKVWELTKVRTTCSYCGVGCQMWLHVKDNRVVKVTGVEDVGPNYGSLCVKGRFGFDFIHDARRLTTPLIKENGAFREASWEEALNLVAERLDASRGQWGPDAIGLFSSARMTNEENYVAQKFARAVLGTNNVDHCARLCHASTVAGLAAAFGSGAMTNPIEDIEEAGVILVTGSNTTETHPVLSSYIKRAVTFKGAKLIVVDPREIVLTRFATLWLRQRLGTDVAWINGLMHVIIKEGLHDEAYVKARTVGFEELKSKVERYTPERVEEITGIPKEQIVAAARLYASVPAASIIYCMGITQHTTGTDNVKSLANLAMLCGNVGVRGGGVNPLRGQNNVQGACDMGALPNVYSGYQRVTDEAIRRRMEQAWGVKELPKNPGLAVTEMVEAAHRGDIKALYIIGENPMVSDPDQNHARAALEKLDFLVVQDIFLTETAKLAHVVLPSVSFAEKDGTFTNTERKVQRVRKAVLPPGEAREDWRILCDLSQKMGVPMDYESPREIMDEIARVTPSYCGIHFERLEREGISWPCPGTDHPGTPCLHMDQFTCGLGVFHAIDHVPPAELPDPQYPFYLTTGRVLYQYHTGTMTMKSEGLNALAPECFVEISPADASAQGIGEGSRVRLVSRRGLISVRARVSQRVPQGTLFVPFHFAEAAANALTHAALDPVAKIPELKVCAVRLEKE